MRTMQMTLRQWRQHDVVASGVTGETLYADVVVYWVVFRVDGDCWYVEYDELHDKRAASPGRVEESLLDGTLVTREARPCWCEVVVVPAEEGSAGGSVRLPGGAIRPCEERPRRPACEDASR